MKRSRFFWVCVVYLALMTPVAIWSVVDGRPELAVMNVGSIALVGISLWSEIRRDRHVAEMKRIRNIR